MKAAICEKYGPPEVLQIKEIEKPVPKSNEVLIKVLATAVTAADYRVRGAIFPPMFAIPARLSMGWTKPNAPVLGINLSGVIESVGVDVKSFKVGDEVFGSTGFGFGAYAEYKCLPESGSILTKPANMNFVEAATIPFGSFTSLFFLRDKGKIQEGQRVLINGASGAVGTAGVQIAKYYGAHVTGVCSTVNIELVKSLGADEVIDYTKEDFTKKEGTYDIIFDTVGFISVVDSMKRLTDNGVYLACVIDPQHLAQMILTSMFGTKKVIGATSEGNKEDLVFIKGLIEQGKLITVIDRTYPFEEIVEAHRYVQKGHKKGNVAITLDHTESLGRSN